MEKNLNERFALYLKDVIEYYHVNGSLRNFSKITQKHKITAIPQELFFKYGLDKMQAGSTPTIPQCVTILNDIRSRKGNPKNNQTQEVENKEPKFKAGSIIAYENKDGIRSIAYVGEDDYAWFTLNYRLNAQEKDRIWIYDVLPYSLMNGTLKVVEPTKEDYEMFIKELSKELDYKFKKGNTQKTLF